MFDFRDKWLMSLALLAVVVRAAYLVETSFAAGFETVMVDELWHWQWGQAILSGPSFWGEGAYFRAPLYPYFLALLEWITSSSVLWSKLLQSLLCAGTSICIFRLAEHLFDRKIAIISGFIYAFYGTLIFYETMFLIPALFLFLTVWGISRLVIYQHELSVKTWLGTGLVFGLAAISRPNILLTVPFLLLWLYFASDKTRPSGTRLKAPLIMALGLMLAILPVTVRNMIVTGEFMMISSQGGINLYLGNNIEADGLTMRLPEVQLSQAVDWSHFISATRAAAELEAGTTLTPGEESTFWTKKALAFMVDNPGPFLSLLYHKSVYLLSGFENSDNADIYFQRRKSVLHSGLVWKSFIAFPYGLLIPLALAGVLLQRRRIKDLAPIYIFILAYTPTIILFLVTARHRLPLVPFLIILAAVGGHFLITQLKTLSRSQLLTIVLPAIIVGVLFNQTYFEEGRNNDFQNHYNEGLKYLRLNDYLAAEREFLKADRHNPYSAPLLNNLGYVQFTLGKQNEANRNYHRAIAVMPEFSKTYNNLGLLVEKQGLSDSAILLFKNAVDRFDSVLTDKEELAQYYINMADVYAGAGKTDTAALGYEAAVFIAPDMGKTYYRAAVFYARNDMFEKSNLMYQMGMQKREPSASEAFNYGLSLLRQKKFKQSIPIFKIAVSRDSSLFQASFCVASAFYDLGAPIDSISKYLGFCFNYNPYYEPALKLRQALQSGGK